MDIGVPKLPLCACSSFLHVDGTKASSIDRLASQIEQIRLEKD